MLLLMCCMDSYSMSYMRGWDRGFPRRSQSFLARKKPLWWITLCPVPKTMCGHLKCLNCFNPSWMMKRKCLFSRCGECSSLKSRKLRPVFRWSLELDNDGQVCFCFILCGWLLVLFYLMLVFLYFIWEKDLKISFLSSELGFIFLLVKFCNQTFSFIPNVCARFFFFPSYCCCLIYLHPKDRKLCSSFPLNARKSSSCAWKLMVMVLQILHSLWWMWDIAKISSIVWSCADNLWIIGFSLSICVRYIG